MSLVMKAVMMMTIELFFYEIIIFSNLFSCSVFKLNQVIINSLSMRIEKFIHNYETIKVVW